MSTTILILGPNEETPKDHVFTQNYVLRYQDDRANPAFHVLRDRLAEPDRTIGWLDLAKWLAERSPARFPEAPPTRLREPICCPHCNHGDIVEVVDWSATSLEDSANTDTLHEYCCRNETTCGRSFWV